MAWLWSVGAAGAQTAVAWRQMGLARRAQGDTRGAIAALEKAVTLEPQNPTGYVLLGWTQHLAGQSEPAARSLWRAIVRHPTHIEAFQALGIVYLVRGELTPAIWSHLWAAVWHPQGEIAPYNLSLAYHRQGLPTLALAYGQRAAALTPDNPHPWLALALAHDQDGNRRAMATALRTAQQQQGALHDPEFRREDLTYAGFDAAQIAQINRLWPQGLAVQ
ncbi:MAG: tetratricopeptide repeat protein [Pseudanabaenaceae cyanobacterium]